MSDMDTTDFAAELERVRAKAEARMSTPEGREQMAAELQREADEQRRSADEERERPFATLSACGVPRRVVDTVRTHSQTPAVRRITRWVEERRRDPASWCLVLSAPKGLGKSVSAGLWMLHSGAKTISHTAKTGESVQLPSWWPISRFARIEGFDGKFDAVCEHTGPVVLDDIGGEYLDKNGWFLQAFDAFIDARYREYLPTLLTTNLNAAEFKLRYSDRVVDRIREGGSFYEFAGESLRRSA